MLNENFEAFISSQSAHNQKTASSINTIYLKIDGIQKKITWFEDVTASMKKRMAEVIKTNKESLA